LDLSFTPFDRDQELIAWPGDLAALMIGVAARQGASPTAMAQAELANGELWAPEAGLFAPEDGAFNGKVAAALKLWKEG
jgi:hypothetical protein